MRHALVVTLIVAALAASAPATAGTVAPALKAQLDVAQEGELFGVIVHMRDQAPIEALSADLTSGRATRRDRHEQIVLALKGATASQEPLVAELQQARAAGDVVGFTRYWISNLLVVQATAETILRIADRADVEHVESNFTASLITPVAEDPPAGDGDELGSRGIGMAPGIAAVRAPLVWNELGIDGTGALIGSLDTGVAGNHPSLASRWRGLSAPASESWLDVVGSGTTFPTDPNSHGTHTVGTMCGLAPDDTIGIAPGAQWIACNAINQGAGPAFDNDIIAAFQWFADPDGNPATVDDVPDVVQNSWGVHEGFSGYNDCDSRWWAVIDNCEAAGVVTVWSAGNEGPGAGSLRSPADRATNFYSSFSVGSTLHYAPYAISGFSSRGPSTCGGVVNPAYLTKPEISAPGSDIYSAVPSGYGYKSGTSMSGPHVAGVVALMRSANPDLEVNAIKQILMETAIDLGAVGEDNTYGHGFLDAYAAVLAAMTGFGSIEGVATNASFEGAPLQGARIDFAASAMFYVTGADGRFSGMAAPGVHELTCSLPGFAPGYATVEVTADNATVQDFTLVDIVGPAITNVTQPVFTTDTAGPYVIAAEVRDQSTVVSVDLIVRMGEGLPVIYPMTSMGDDTYSAAIPGAPINSTIVYSVVASDGAGLLSDSGEFTLLVGSWVYVTDAEDPGDPDWQLGVAGDNATSGLWVRADPVGTFYNGVNIQPEDDHTPAPGVACYVTGNGAVGGAAGENDVDNGCTTLMTPVFDLSGIDRAFVSYWRWYGEGGNSVDDDFVVQATNDGGASWVEVERVVENENWWQYVAVELGSLAGGSFALTDQVRLRFLACDLNVQGLVEAAIDDFGIATFSGTVTGVEDGLPGTPAALTMLHQNHPNPFNPSTTIAFALPADGQVDLAVYTVDGRRVATLVRESLAAGNHVATWDGRDAGGRRVASGAYFYRLRAGDDVLVRRMVMATGAASHASVYPSTALLSPPPPPIPAPPSDRTGTPAPAPRPARADGRRPARR